MCQESRDSLESLDPADRQDRKDLREYPDQTESANQGWTAHQDNQGRRAAKDNQVHQGCQGNQDYRELANQDIKDQRVIKGREASLVQLDRREIED